MAYVKDERPETMMVEGDWQVGAYRYKAPRLLEEFTQGLKQKKLVGSLCLGCGKVIVQPRQICGRCHRIMDERRIVSEFGAITCFVISPPVVKGKYKLFGLDPVDTGALKEGEVMVPCFVRFDGSDSNIACLLLNVKPEKVFIGLRVKAVWAKELKGAMSDLEGVEPIEKLA